MSKAKKINIDVLRDISGGTNVIENVGDGNQIFESIAVDDIDTCEWNECPTCGQGISGSHAWEEHKKYCPGHPVDYASPAISNELEPITKDKGISII